MQSRTSPFDSLDKGDLYDLCDRLLASDPEAVRACEEFFEAETFGDWHGRARAMMARRFKHVTLSALQRKRLISAVLGRLARGEFSEGFYDQLRLVLKLAPERAFDGARTCRQSPLEHVRRYAAWVLEHEKPPHPGPPC
jgi:hypothetical protein